MQPLDVGTPKTSTATPTLSTESPSTSQIPPAHPSTTPNSSKKRIPCFYFKKGMCLKGDNCFFMHGPLSIVNPILQKIPDSARAVTVNTQTFKMPSWSLNNSASQQNTLDTVSVRSPMVIASAAKSVNKAEKFPAKSFSVRNNLVPAPLDIKIPPKSHVENKSSDGSTLYRRSLASSIHKNGKSEKSVCKSSPGLNAQDNYISDDDENINHSTNVDHTTAFRKPHTQDHDRDLEISPERRNPSRIKSHFEMDGSDLRHQLLKHRRLNVSSSSASSDHRSQYKGEGNYIEGHDYRYRKHSNDHSEVSVSKRLHGRIRPATDSFVDNAHLGRDLERERNTVRSPGKPAIQGGISDRLGQRVTEVLSAETGNNGFLSQEPKELKGSDDFEMRYARNNIGMRLGDDICSFEGPKSLSEILKRKRKRGVASGNGEISNYDEDSSDKNIDSSIVQTNSLGCDEKHQTLDNIKEAEIDVAGEEKKRISSEVEDVQIQACTNNEDLVEMEDSTIVENLEDAEYENYEQDDEEYEEYEEIEGEENGYDLEDENGDGDESEFGKKLKVMFSESAS